MRSRKGPPSPSTQAAGGPGNTGRRLNALRPEVERFKDRGRHGCDVSVFAWRKREKLPWPRSSSRLWREGSGGVKIPMMLICCRYCGHGQTSGTKKSRMINCLFTLGKAIAVRIIGIAQCDKVQECLDFKPNPMFGICEYCTFTNSFHPDFVQHPALGEQAAVFQSGMGLLLVHAFTCDRYQ